MIRENIPALRARLDTLIQESRSLQRILGKIEGAEDVLTVSAQQRDAAMTAVQNRASNIQTAFDDAKAVFTATQTINIPDA